MAERIPESLLEMHHHSALVAHYAALYGAKVMKLYKPVPQKEAWVGFDQAWTRTDLTQAQLHDALVSAVQVGGKSIGKFYVGEFLQFKVMDRKIRASKVMPSGFSTPYIRTELSLAPNKLTGISQHETLRRLSGVAGASVYYACPMLFESDEIWEQPADLTKLRLVDVKSSPSGWLTNESHHLIFQDAYASPLWCSDPLPATGLDFLQRPADFLPHTMSGEAAIEFIGACERAVRQAPDTERRQRDLIEEVALPSNYLPECFALYEFVRI